MSATCRRHDTECRHLGKKTTRRHPTYGAKLFAVSLRHAFLEKIADILHPVPPRSVPQLSNVLQYVQHWRHVYTSQVPLHRGSVNATDRAKLATPSIATIRMWRENPVDPNES